MAKTIKKATQTKAPAKNTSVETAMKAVAAKKPEVKAAAPAPVKKTEEKPAAKAEVKPAVKETEEKVAEKKTRKPRKKTVKKPVEKIQEVFVEFNGEQFKTASIIEKIHEVYKAEGHRVGAIKSLRVYIDPVERKAYYVINDKAEGKYVEF